MQNGTDPSWMRALPWLIGLPLVLWTAVALSGAEKGLEGLTAALAQPMALHWTRDSPRVVLLFLLLYGAIAVGVEGTRPNLRPGREHGSAKWGSATALDKQFAERKDFNEDAKETMKDKIKRLMENDVKATQHTA